jgi:hypothetical protein
MINMKNVALLIALLPPFLSSLGQDKKWHDLEGVFQSPVNKEMYVRFTARDSLLVANLLWNNTEIHLLPDTGLAFVSREKDDGEPIHIHFLRDPSGAVNHVNVSNDGVWIRTTKYKPNIRTEIAHTPGQLQKYIGFYQAKEDTSRYLQLIVDSNTLTIVQNWDGNKIDNFVPDSGWTFFKKERPNMTLQFSRDQQGRVTQFLAFGRDIWIEVATTTPSAAILKTYEGKFRSADDPDNEVQLIAAGKELVVRELWNKKEIRVQPITNTYFNSSDLSFPIQLIMGDNGKVKQFILLGNQNFVRIE